MPNNVPISFTGGVGDFKVTMTISKIAATTDEAISLRMKVTGNGDVKRWLAPKLQPIEGLEIYDPKTVHEQSVENQGEWQTTKDFEYLILPKKAGDFTIKSEFSYLNTSYGDKEEGQFKTDSIIFNLTITQGKNKVATVSSDDDADIHGLKASTNFINENNPFYGSTMFWVLTVLPFVFFAGVFAYKQFLLQKGKIDVSTLNSQNAQKVAQHHLAAAYDFMTKGNPRLFYDEISKALFTYSSNKFNIPLSEFSKNNVEEKLKSLNINSLHIDKFKKILNQSELALFAGGNTEGGMHEIYQGALQVITDIEKDLK